MLNRYAVFGACAVALVGAGFAAGQKLGEIELEKEKAHHAEVLAQISADNAARLSEAVARAKRVEREKDRALADLIVARKQNDVVARANRDLVGRLRDNAAAYGAGAGAGDGACGAVERQLAESLRLHAEGAGLLAEAVELVGGLDADRTAARKINESINESIKDVK